MLCPLATADDSNFSPLAASFACVWLVGILKFFQQVVAALAVCAVRVSEMAVMESSSFLSQFFNKIKVTFSKLKPVLQARRTQRGRVGGRRRRRRPTDRQTDKTTTHTCTHTHLPCWPLRLRCLQRCRKLVLYWLCCCCCCFVCRCLLFLLLLLLAFVLVYWWISKHFFQYLFICCEIYSKSLNVLVVVVVAAEPYATCN